MREQWERITTPYYCFKEKDLLYDVELLRGALEENWGNYLMSYSVKTNSLPWLLTYLKKRGFYAEIVSEIEYDLVQRLGFSDHEIVYNGPIKSREVWESVLLGRGYVNLDSSDEPKWLESLCRTHPGKIFRVGLRVNCLLDNLIPGVETSGGKRGRFGYCYENGSLGSVIDRLRSIPGVRIAGLHLHTSTQSRKPETFAALAGMAVKIAGEYGLDLEYVDMGGGYFGGCSDMPSYPDYFRAICRKLREGFDPATTRLIVEPGVSLISRGAALVSTVLDIKEVLEGRFIVTDSSRVYLNPMVTRHSYPHHIEYRGKPEKEREPVGSQWICGSTCMEHDKLFEIKGGRELMPGDRIIYDRAGGYTLCLVPLFIHYFPAVWIEKEDGELFLARKEWTNEEYLQKNFWE